MNFKTLLALGTFSLIFVAQTQAFFTTPKLQRTEKQVKIEIHDGENVHVEMTEKIKNNSTEAQALTVYEPLPGTLENVKFYVEFEGQPFNILEKEERLNRLFERAKEHQNARFFRFAKPPFHKFFQAQPYWIPAQKTATVKIEYDTKIDFAENFYFKEIFTNDELKPEKFELILNISTKEPIRHFFTNLPPEFLLDRGDRSLTLLLEKKNFLPEENIKFFWSHTDDAMLKYPSREKTYYAHFLTPPPKKAHQEITFLIDKSGSVSGQPWARTKDFLQFMLEHLDEQNIDAKVRMVLFAEEIEFYNEDFQENTFEFRKQFFEHIKHTQTVGKTDLTQAFEAIKEGWASDKVNRTIILITDSEDWVAPSDVSAPVVALSFAKNIDSPLQTMARLSGGFSIRLFRNPYELIESNEFLQKWENWHAEVVKDMVVPNTNESDILPHKFKQVFTNTSTFFVGRTDDITPEAYIEAANFLPRVWAARQIATMLHQKNYTLEKIENLLALGRAYGIKTRFFHESTSPEDLLREVMVFDQVNTSEILEREILRLEDPNIFSPLTNARFYRDKPLYFVSEDNVWQQYDFQATQQQATDVQIAPFTEAQKVLFIRFPEILAEGFGISREVEFCTEIRCFSIRENQRGESQVSDILPFEIQDYFPNHWANPYLFKAINTKLMGYEPGGRIKLNTPLSRGEFVRMLGKHLFFEAIKNRDRTQEKKFIDLTKEEGESVYATVQYLVQQNVIEGYPDQTFRPDRPLSRAEAVKILLASKGFQPSNTEDDPSFPDSTDWTKPWVNKSKDCEIVKGYPDGTFKPHQSLTLAEGLKLILTIKEVQCEF